MALKMRQKCVKNASKMRQKCVKNALKLDLKRKIDDEFGNQRPGRSQGRDYPRSDHGGIGFGLECD